jgi:NAD(P)-dependent dehydrogenase (short-subunit alcohol dehydrogenase family)
MPPPTDEPSPLRAALVTGAARRIGLAIAERLARSGYRVALHCSPASQEEAAKAAARLAREVGEPHIFAVAGDLADPFLPDRLITIAQAALGPLSLLVNNASLFVADEAATFDLDRWEKHFAVNLRAPVLLARAFAKQVRAGQAASIVNIIDQRVWRLTPKHFTYTLSKSALWTATQTLAQAFAPQGIRVNAVGPGPVLPNAMDGSDGLAAEVAGVPLRHAPSVQDVADAVLYLATAQAVTGQMIAVDAGQHLSWQTPDVVAR